MNLPYMYNRPQVDMSLHSDTLSRVCSNSLMQHAESTEAQNINFIDSGFTQRGKQVSIKTDAS